MGIQLDGAKSHLIRLTFTRQLFKPFRWNFTKSIQSGRVCIHVSMRRDYLFGCENI